MVFFHALPQPSCQNWLRVLRRCSHPLALITDLYHRRARRKTPRRNRRMTLVEEACRSNHSRCQPVQRTSLHECSSGGRCLPTYAHCCTRVRQAADVCHCAVCCERVCRPMPASLRTPLDTCDLRRSRTRTCWNVAGHLIDGVLRLTIVRLAR